MSTGYTITVASAQKGTTFDGVLYNVTFNLIQLTDRHAVSKTLMSGSTKGNTNVQSSNTETVEFVFMDKFGLPLDATQITSDKLAIVEIFKIGLETGVRYYVGEQSKKIVQSLEQSYEDAIEVTPGEFEQVFKGVSIEGVGTLLMYGKKVPDPFNPSLFDLTENKMVLFEFGAH